MAVDEKSAELKSECNGITYYFCSPDCKYSFNMEFEKAPPGGQAVSKASLELSTGAAAVSSPPHGVTRFMADWISRYWLQASILLLVVYAGLPWLAPLFMRLGWEQAGNTIYLIYSTQCHQLPQRSFFLFGQQPMFSLAEVQAAWQNTTNPMLLRQFTGNVAMGWKVAWSDRMVAMYGSLLLFSLLFWAVRRRLRPLPWWGLVLLLLPMALDGASHMISDIAGGIGGGFRDSNVWLAIVTGQALPTDFYASDALGSFNSWTRLISGFLFGLGAIWFAYPRLERSFSAANKTKTL